MADDRIDSTQDPLAAWGESPNPYGSVPGLDDDELADPQELERLVYIEEWGPILALPGGEATVGVAEALGWEGHGPVGCP